MLLRTLTLLLLLSPFLAARAADIPTTPAIDDVARFMDADKTTSRDTEPTSRPLQQGFGGSVSLGGQWQSSTAPAFNRYGNSAFPGNDASFSFEGKH